MLVLFLNASKISAKNNNLEKAYNFLSFVADKNIKYKFNEYNNLFPDTFSSKIDFAKTDNVLKNKLINEILAFEFINFQTDLNDAFSLLFYKFALLSSQSLDSSLVPIFLNTSVYLFPELSYYHIELSNYYLSIGQKEKSKETIGLCVKLLPPKSFCEEYLEKYNKRDIYFLQGFLLEDTEKFFKKTE
ncbi:MAG: hypothetical protein ABIJ05_00520 [Patescibacteria group bacterium]